MAGAIPEWTKEELNGYSEQTIFSAFDSQILELIILPTEKCNFRCTYCYEDFSRGAMKPELYQSLVKLISHRMSDLRFLRLSWFGGEPLLAWKAIQQFVDRITGMCHDSGVVLEGGFTTNAFNLDNKKIEWLAARNHARFQVTLDGLAEDHDKSRVLANGSPTFAKIWQVLLAALESDLEFQILVRIHVSPQNKNSVHRLVEEYKKRFGEDRRFSVHFHRVSDLGGPHAGKFPTLGYNEYREVLSKLKEILEDSHANVESEVDKVEQRDICYAARANSLVIRSDGVVGKCTVALDDPRNHIGVLNDDGTLTIENEKLKYWMKGFDDFSVKALSCPLSALPESSLDIVTISQ